MKCDRCGKEVPRLYKSRDSSYVSGLKDKEGKDWFDVCYGCYKLRARIKQASILAETSNWHARKTEKCK